jgi:lauroyl/myristoyl acyltransferase/ADP-heptose:LPS heptosyltransferase
VLYWFLSFLGRSLAALPTFFPAGIARVVGWLIFRFGGPRRRAILSNLHHAFPEKNETWRRKIALESCCRTVEMGLFVLASPYFSVWRIRRMFHTDQGWDKQKLDGPGVPEIALVPHFSLMESLTLVAAIFPQLRKGCEIGVFYRPFNNAGLERWVKATRERFGMHLISRREGFGGASEILRGDGGRVAVLFDQHAGGAGSLSLFFGRLVSTSQLGGLLAEKHRAGVFLFYTERTGFWRGIVRGERLLHGPKLAEKNTLPLSASAITIASNIWLENKLRSSDSWCADWLWLHQRWKIGTNARERFHIRPQHRDILAENLAALHLNECPRKERFWIQLPDAPAETLAALPVLRALRSSRPDAEMTLLVPPLFAPLLKPLGVADRVLVLPSGDLTRRHFFRNLRNEYPDTHILLDDSRRAATEARLLGAPQRFGIQRKWRRGLTHTWTPPEGLNETHLRRPRLWELWWKNAHGLSVDADFSPARLRSIPAPAKGRPVVALISAPGCAPAARRWPAAHWRQLATALVGEHGATLRVFGKPCAWRAFADIAETLPPGAVENFTANANSTAIETTTAALAGCTCAAGQLESSGLLHLANLLGVPVVGLYGLENPLRDAPVFNAPSVTLQPPGCPSIGGQPVAKISPEQVLQACAVFCA